MLNVNVHVHQRDLNCADLHVHVLNVQEEVGDELDDLGEEVREPHEDEDQIERKRAGVDELDGRVLDRIDLRGIAHGALVHYPATVW